MKIARGYDEKTIENIAKNCGSRSVKGSVAWLRRANYNNPDKFVCEILDDVAFWAADICKTHMRLYEIAVESGSQGNGYGRAMILRIVSECRKRKLDRITFRVSKEEGAMGFYKKMGAEITGSKGNDWEAEIKI